MAYQVRKKQSKAEDIYEYIYDQILQGRWKPGDRVNDLELADEIQVSRLSVREALFKLLETGIIEKIHWKGYFLTIINDQIIQDIVDIRVALESLAITNILNDPEPQVFHDMKETIDRSEVLLSERKLAKYLKMDFHFHELLYTKQKNQYIAKTLNNYLILIHFIRVICMGTDENFIKTAEDSIRDHRSILQCLIDNNIEGALNNLKVHLVTHQEKTKFELHQANP